MIKKLYKYDNNFTRKIITKLIIKKENGQMWSKTLRELYKEFHGIEIGIGSYGGCFNYFNIPKGTVVGKYCSFAQNVYIFPVNHPKEHITTHPFIFNPSVGFVEKDIRSWTKLKVGNDVWIGANAIILSKVKSVGNGAIIGAGSVVTKDVPPYAIVAGNPAKVLGYRFNEEDIKRIEATEWWNWDKEKIKSKVEIFENKTNFFNNN